MFLWDEGGSWDSALAVYDLVHHGYVDQLLRSERFGIRKILMLVDQTFLWNLTKIFREGSASARRPAVTQAVAPPDPIQVVSTTVTLIEWNLKAPYLLRKWYRKLYCHCRLRTLWDPIWREQDDRRYLLTLGDRWKVLTPYSVHWFLITYFTHYCEILIVNLLTMTIGSQPLLYTCLKSQ